MNDKIYVDLCDAINRHYDDYANCKDEDEKVNMTLDVIRGQFALLKEIVKAGKFKDTFEYFYHVGGCIITTAKSGKTDTAYSLMYDFI